MLKDFYFLNFLFISVIIFKTDKAIRASGAPCRGEPLVVILRLGLFLPVFLGFSSSASELGDGPPRVYPHQIYYFFNCVIVVSSLFDEFII
jgi:hypothetical protein